MKVVLITGMLAAGKSIALRFFQDLGYYCVDNLPSALISQFMELVKSRESSIDKVAIVIDMRSLVFFSELENALNCLRGDEHCRILYIDANDSVLIQRYKAQRRRHLMSANERIELTLARERAMLSPLREIADYIIDTSETKDSELREKLRTLFDDEYSRLRVDIVSFGYKYGIPKDADLVFDVRFLPNPYYVSELKTKNGTDAEVFNYVYSFDDSRDFLNRLVELIVFLLPRYESEGRSQLIIALGCTGGRHRSVASAEALAKELTRLNYLVTTEHRDIRKDDY